VIGKKLQFFEERITSCQLLHHMLQDNRDTNKCLRDTNKCLRVTSRAHRQSQMLLAQDTFQVSWFSILFSSSNSANQISSAGKTKSSSMSLTISDHGV